MISSTVRATLLAALASLALAGNALAATFTPSDDAFATTADPAAAYGTGQWIRVGSGTATRVAYFKFPVTGLTGSVTKATLRVYNVTGGTGFSVRAVPSTTWSETTLSWNNKPAYSATVTASVGSFAVNTWVAIDVTPLVAANGTYSFALTSAATTPMDFTGKEYGAANAPQLVVTTAAAPAPPANTALPAISGTAQQDQTLTASNGSWTNSPTGYAYQWKRCDSAGAACTAVVGASASSYTLASADVSSTMRVTVTASNSGGSGAAASAQTAVVSPASTTTIPVVSAVSVSSVSAFSATVNWTTDVPSSSVVEYGTATSYGLWSPVDTTAVTSHSVTLTDLTFHTSYHFHVLSRNSAGAGSSGDSTFTTTSLPATARRTSVSFSKQFLVDGHPFFPIMQWLQCGSLLDTNVALGVDVFMGNSCSGTTNQSYLDQVQQRNALGIVDYDGTVKSHPALAGWSGLDEPDTKPNYPADLQRTFDANRANDPNHVNFLTLSPNFFSALSAPSWMNGDRTPYKQYAAAADFPGFDIYPIYGWCQPNWIWWQADATKEWTSTYSPSKPNYSWIEAAGTSSQWCTGRAVLDYEVRSEVWMTIANGSKGIGWFTHSWSPTYSQFRVDPTVQTEMARSDRQVTNFTLPLLGPSAAVTQQVLTSGGRIDYVARQWNGATYVFAVNVNRTSADVRFNGASLAGKSVKVYEEGRTIAADSTGFTDTFAALAVHVYITAPAGA